MKEQVKNTNFAFSSSEQRNQASEAPPIARSDSVALFSRLPHGCCFYLDAGDCAPGKEETGPRGVSLTSSQVSTVSVSPVLAASLSVQTCIFQSRKLRHREFKGPIKGGNPPSHAATVLQTGYLFPHLSSLSPQGPPHSLRISWSRKSQHLGDKRERLLSESPTCNWHDQVSSSLLSDKAKRPLKSLECSPLNKDIRQPWAVPAAFKATAQSQF